MNLCWQVMSLLFNILSGLVITFLPRSNCLLISWLLSPSAVILEPPQIKSATVSIVSPFICHEVMGLDAMILVFWMLSFKPTFHSPLSLSSKDSLVLHFLPQVWCHLHIWGYWYFSGNLTGEGNGKPFQYSCLENPMNSIKKAEHQRTESFELWCCIRLLRVPWTARGSDQSILREISPEYSLGFLMLTLKLQ